MESSSQCGDIGFTDIDCIPEPDWLDRIVAVVEMSEALPCFRLSNSSPRNRFTASEWYDAHFFQTKVLFEE